MRPPAKDIGLAIVGGGRVGLFRGEVANRHPAVKWIGLAEKNPNRAGEVASTRKPDTTPESSRSSAAARLRACSTASRSRRARCCVWVS